MPKIKDNRHFLLAACLICVISGFVYMAVNPDSIVPREDAIEYDQIGWNIAQGKGFSLDGLSPTVLRGPVYPYFLSVIYLFFGHNYSIVQVIQIIIHMINCYLIFRLAKIFQEELIAIAASFLYALYPAFLFYTGLILTETLTIFLLQCAILFFVKGFKDQSYIFASFGGVMLGLATLCRPTTILYPIFLLIILMVFKQLRHLVRFGLIFTIGMLLTLSPWIIRNYINFGMFIPVSVYSGYNFLLSTSSQSSPEFDLDAFKLQYRTDAINKDREAFRQGWENIESNPLNYISMMPKSLVRFFLPEGMAVIGNSRTLQGLCLIAFQIILLGFALIGVLQEISSEATMVIISLLIYFILVHLILISTPRFNLPVMPYVIIFACAGLRGTWKLNVIKMFLHQGS